MCRSRSFALEVRHAVTLFICYFLFQFVTDVLHIVSIGFCLSVSLVPVAFLHPIRFIVITHVDSFFCVSVLPCHIIIIIIIKAIFSSYLKTSDYFLVSFLSYVFPKKRCGNWTTKKKHQNGKLYKTCQSNCFMACNVMSSDVEAKWGQNPILNRDYTNE